MFRHFVTGLCLAGCAAWAAPVQAQVVHVAVIDVQRVVTESDPGKASLEKLKQLQNQKLEQGKKLQQELDALRTQFSKQRFTLSEDKLAALQKQIEDKTIALKRFQDDAQRELEDARKRELDGLEQKIMPIINQVGKEKKLTLIFNKFQSGLVYADDSVDITDEIIKRFNTSAK
ncbi:MAG: OmpH family outer membrane protein [Acidobacteria bacterium]|nr:OmpH family outer membrane protein [Acidobacteriota bacterium]